MFNVNERRRPEQSERNYKVKTKNENEQKMKGEKKTNKHQIYIQYWMLDIERKARKESAKNLIKSFQISFEYHVDLYHIVIDLS